MTHPSTVSKVGIRSRALRFAPRRSDWSRATIGRDLSAGLMVALVALPPGARLRRCFWCRRGSWNYDGHRRGHPVRSLRR